MSDLALGISTQSGWSKGFSQTNDGVCNKPEVCGCAIAAAQNSKLIQMSQEKSNLSMKWKIHFWFISGMAMILI